MTKCIYWRQKMFILYQTKNQDRSELILIAVQSFQTEKAPNGGPYHDQDINVIISRRSYITLLHDLMARL